MRNWERRRGPIEYALSQGKTPAQIAARYQTTFTAMNKLLAQWGLLETPAAPRRLLPIADASTAFRDFPALPTKAAPMVAKEHHPDRNERIRHLRRDGINPATISRRLGLSRHVVIGVLHRAGMSMGGDELRKARGKGQKRGGAQTAKQRQKPQNTRDHVWNFSAKAHRNAAVFSKGAKGESTGPINLAKHYEPIPSHAVPIEQLTGCSWPYGDVRAEGIAYCNKPRCQVLVHGFAKPVTVSYCDHHWDIRRTSKNTRIIADNMQRLNGSAAY